jgi:DNA mismatch endonuclease (patch repair protein)
MSRIRATNTKPEVRLRKALWKVGIRYRLHTPVLGIKPDLVIAGSKLAIFVDGCQWHGCPKHYVAPRTRSEFWSQKLLTNVQRDIKQTRSLIDGGWRVLRIWEHEIFEDLQGTVEKVITNLNNSVKQTEDTWRVFRVEYIDVEADLENRYMLSLESPEITTIIQQRRSTRKWSRRHG